MLIGPYSTRAMSEEELRAELVVDNRLLLLGVLKVCRLSERNGGLNHWEVSKKGSAACNDVPEGPVFRQFFGKSKFF